jgi:hypothetical protein
MIESVDSASVAEFINGRELNGLVAGATACRHGDEQRGRGRSDNQPQVHIASASHVHTVH